MNFIDSIYAKAKQDKRKVAVPECTNERMMRVAAKADSDGLAEVIFVGDRNEILQTAEKSRIDISRIKIADTSDEDYKRDLLERYGMLPKRAMGKSYVSKNMKKPLYMSLVMEAVGDVDCTYGALDTARVE